MNDHMGDVPIIRRPARVTIADHRIIVPNNIELLPGGLGIDDSVAHLRASAPLLAKAWWLPLNEAQLDALGSSINQVLMQVNPHDYPRSNHD